MKCFSVLLMLTIAACTSAIVYDGTPNSWAMFSKWNACPQTDKAKLEFQFETEAQDGLLLYMDDGGSTDYLIIKVMNGKLVVEYSFNANESTVFEREDKDVSDGMPHSVSILRERMRMKVEVDKDLYTTSQLSNFGTDLCFGRCTSDGSLSARNSNLYMGGLPPRQRSLGKSLLPPPFKGTIKNVVHKNCSCSLSNPVVVSLGESIRDSAKADPCFGKGTSPSCDFGSFCRDGNVRCAECEPDSPLMYKLNFVHQVNKELYNDYGLDAKVYGQPSTKKEGDVFPYLLLGGGTYAQMAGPSQRDECLGNLNMCPNGYSISFWFAITNDDLTMKEGVLLNNGGKDSHGIAIYWENNKLITKFKKLNGDTWINEADNLWPSQVYKEPQVFVDYWYHYAASWSPNVGLTVYLNGVPVGVNSRRNTGSARLGDRSSFLLLDKFSRNSMKIAEVQFYPQYMNALEIMQKGPIMHYYISMNEIRSDGRTLTMYPNSVNAIVRGNSAAQLVKGKADQALQVGAHQEGYSFVNAGNVGNTCFGNVSICDKGLYTSFWVKFDRLVNDMTILDTGKMGVSLSYQDRRLVAHIYKSEDMPGPVELSWDRPEVGKWYFVELSVPAQPSQDPSELYINGKLVAKSDNWIINREISLGDASADLLIGKKNIANAPVKGSFIIDQFEMLSGDRDLLIDIGHIQRGLPPHALYNMDHSILDQANGQYYVDYNVQAVKQDPRAFLRGNVDFVPGKDLNATSISGDNGALEIINPKRNEECYANIEKCVHGITLRGWFNIEELRENTGILSTGLNGLTLEYTNGQLRAAADTKYRHWQSTGTLDERKWQFVEVSFHPKYGLTVYVDKEKQRSSTSYQNKLFNSAGSDRFLVGATNDNSHLSASMLLDDFEIWYGDRDYLETLCVITPCLGDHFIIDFDEEDLPRGSQRYLKHEQLTIPMSGVLEPGLIINAMDVRNGQDAEVTQVFTDAVADTCFGNLTLCPNGFTTKFYLKPKMLQSSGATYFLSTGTQGINVFYENNRLHAEAEDGGKKWQVISPAGYLRENEWSTIIVAWSPIRGLILARDAKSYLVARDRSGSANSNQARGNSKFLIGDKNRREFSNNPRAAFDDMHIYYQYMPPELILGPIGRDSFSFERNLVGNKVEHPRYTVELRGGADVVLGKIGNTTSLDGNGQYVDLGAHDDVCFGNIELCQGGLTLSFRIKPKGSGYRDDQVILSGDSYDISIQNRKLVAKFITQDKEWVVRSFPLVFDEWQMVDLSWSKDSGLELYINGTNEGANRQGRRVDSRRTGRNMYVGRAGIQTGREYYNGDIDEINFWRATRQELDKKGLVVPTRCEDYQRLVVNMDAVVGGRVPHLSREILVNGNPTVTSGLIDNGINLQGSQSINVGSYVSCQSTLNACGNGFTMRVSIKPGRLRRNSYIISSNPVEVSYKSDNLLHVQYKAENIKWSSTLGGLEEGKWYTIDLSWDDENGMTVYVNGIQRSWLQKANEFNTHYDTSDSFIVGQSNRPVADEQSSDFVVDDLQLWNAKLELLQACGYLPVVESAHHNAQYPDNGEGYIRLVSLPDEFDFDYGGEEELYIRFQTNNQEGLLWYNEDGNIKSYIYLKPSRLRRSVMSPRIRRRNIESNGQIWFVTNNGTVAKKTRMGTLDMSDGKEHELRLRSINGNQVEFNVDNGLMRRIVNTDHRIRFVREHFSIGGHREPNVVTNGEVTSSFRGVIRDVILKGSRDNQVFDIFEKLWTTTPNYIRVQCDVTFDPEIFPICDQGESPITYLKNNTYLILDKSDLMGQKPSLEIRFTTVDHKGLLLLAGNKNSYYFALEIFDGLLYMVTDFGNGPVRKQVSTDIVSDNIPHSAKFIFNTDENRVNVFYDGQRLPRGQEVSLAGIRPAQTLFNGDMYLGGLPSINDYPWHLLSRSGFVGCIEEVQVNTISSPLQDLQKTQRMRNIVEGCVPLPDHCSSNPCYNGGKCLNGMETFTCDCSGLMYESDTGSTLCADDVDSSIRVRTGNEICAQDLLIGNLRGDAFYDIDLGEDRRTHTNDITTLFKTPAEMGTLLITGSPSTNDYLRAYLDGGQLKVDITINGKRTGVTIPGVYNDQEWHTLNIKRRADNLKVWVDDQTPESADLNAENIYLNVKSVRLGANAPNAGNKPYVSGHLKNMIIDGISLNGKAPFIDICEKIININAVTFLTSEAYLTLDNNEDELQNDFKVLMNIKTKQPDSLFMYQPGRDGSSQHLAALLDNGNLNVRFNFGDKNELIPVYKDLSDDKWHNIMIWRKNINTLVVSVDGMTPIIKTLDRSSVISNLQFDHGNTMYLGGIPSNILPVTAVRDQMTSGYKGCMSTFVKSRKTFDLGSLRDQIPELITSGAVVRGCVALPECLEEQCMNGCQCAADGSVCESTDFPYHGAMCEKYMVGFEFYHRNHPGSVTYKYIPVESTLSDQISFGFITCAENGLLTKITGANDEMIRISMENGRVVAQYQLGGRKGTIRSSRRYNDEKLYTVQFSRDGPRAELRILSTDELLESKSTVVSGDGTFNSLNLLEIGSEKIENKYVNGFRGIIFGFKHNRVEVMDLARSLHVQTNTKTPGTRVVSGNPAEAFECKDLPAGACGPGLPRCENYGVCQDNRCNCSLTSWVGDYCTEEAFGIYYGYNRFDKGVVHHQYPAPVTTNEDYLALGFMTYEPTGTLLRVESEDGSQYYHIRMVDGYAQLEYNLDGVDKVVREDKALLNSNESVYQMIRMNRTGPYITFYVNDFKLNHTNPDIANIPFERQWKVTTGGQYFPSTEQINDDFNGIIAGIYYNNKRILESSSNIRKGDVFVAPHPFKLKLPRPEICLTCGAYGTKLSNGTCDCLYTAGFVGPCCTIRSGEIWGFQHKKEGGNSVVVYRNDTMQGSSIDDLAIGFVTAKGWKNGEIVRIVSKDGVQRVIVEIIDDNLQVRHNIGGGDEKFIRFREIDVRRQKEHILRLHRNGTYGYIRLDNSLEEDSNMFPNANIFDANIIYTGGYDENGKAINGHYGIIWGLVYNGKNIIDLTRAQPATPGISVVSTGEDNFDIVTRPWPELHNKGTVPPVIVTPGAPGGAGAVVPFGTGGGVAVGVGGGGGGGGGVSTGAIIGAVMGGLLFSSAIAWAAFGMKPGFLAVSGGRMAGGKGAYVPVAGAEKSGAFPTGNGNYLTTVGMEDLQGRNQYGGGGGGGGGGSQYEDSFTQESRFDAADGMVGSGMNGTAGGGYNQYNQSSSWYTRNETLENQGLQGYGTMGSGMGYGAGGMRSGYAGSVAGGSVTGSTYGFGTVTNPDQAFITLSEDIAVENVVLTTDGRYVVTGSNLGPPQVWNTTNGEMVTTMKGDYMGSTGLHLAANEKYLVGETMAEQAAVDMNDIQTGNHIPIRRVAVWDFNTGSPLPIAVDQLCTASCVSKDGYKVVMAMTDKFGGGTAVKVLDLLTNTTETELTYPDSIGVADSASCVFISPDDRFVAVGFTNSFDNNANFIVFDLQNRGSVVDSPIVALNADPHCTVILNHDEALTGTRNGELVIWSMKTGKAQRQLTSGDATMLGFGGMPAAHDREVKEVSLSDDGKYLASASADRTVKIWNMDTESLLHTLNGHNDEVWTVDIASDNSIIVSGSQDGNIKLWRLKTGNQVTSFNATMDIFHARFSKDKRTVVALGDKYGARKLIMLQIVSHKKWRVKS